jgi:Cu-Zn family superoxide dismutase
VRRGDHIRFGPARPAVFLNHHLLREFDMHRLLIPVLGVLTATTAGSVSAQQASGDGPPPVRAVFAFTDSSGSRAGQVNAIQNPDGVLLQVLATGLVPGLHALHLHGSPDCEPPAFQSAGGHFNPGARQHGAKNPAGPHAGDLPNLVANDKGEARAQLLIAGATLSPGPNSIGVPGTALVIHANPDDELTDPAGNAGARIACAIISIATP